MKFTLEIELGNAMMANPYDVANALVNVAADLNRNGLIGVGDIPARIKDVNGNTVGSWQVTA